jgi:hypothetical protein
VSPATAPAAGTHAARSTRIPVGHAPPHNGAAQGLEVSLRYLL